jgi:hypothetical protein
MQVLGMFDRPVYILALTYYRRQFVALASDQTPHIPHNICIIYYGGCRKYLHIPNASDNVIQVGKENRRIRPKNPCSRKSWPGRQACNQANPATAPNSDYLASLYRTFISKSKA